MGEEEWKIKYNNLQKQGFRFPIAFLPLITALTNAIIENKEVEVKPARRNMTLEYVGGKTKISPTALLDTGAQVSCYRSQFLRS